MSEYYYYHDIGMSKQELFIDNKHVVVLVLIVVGVVHDNDKLDDDTGACFFDCT